jgi:serine/threonine protein kinase
MRFYPLGSLADLIKRKTNAPQIDDANWDSALMLTFMRDATRAILAMHQTGLVHNDIKSSNILLEKIDALQNLIVPYRLVVCDFGLAAVTDQKLMGVKAFTLPTVQGASMAYAAPERLQRAMFGNHLDATPQDLMASDVYSVAMVFYEILNRSIAWSQLKMSAETLRLHVMNGQRPVLSDAVKKRASDDRTIGVLVQLMTAAWHQQPTLRPSMAEIEMRLHSIAAP